MAGTSKTAADNAEEADKTPASTTANQGPTVSAPLADPSDNAEDPAAKQKAAHVKPGAKTEKAASRTDASADQPFPSQADLDAIRDGSYHKREARAEGDALTYKTR